MKIIVLALCCVLTAAVTQRRLTDAEQQQAIDKLNEVRRRVANGEAINKDGNKLPPAADMQQLNVDTTFEDQAYTWVTNCNYDYQPNSNQLINAFDSLTSDYMGSLNAAIEQWYNSSHQFSGNVSKFQDDDNTDFTTLAWNTLNLTGCAVGLCPQLKNGDNYLNNFTFVACNFNAGSNWIGKPIYDPGTGCESCAYGYRCNNSLCYYDTQLPPRTPGWLTIGERKAVLDTVNGHRRDLANGNVTDANGKTLPTGSNILEVEYDIGLQSIAVNNFTECTSGFRDLADYNVLSIMLQGVETPDGQEYKGAFEYAINSWWWPAGYNNSISNYQGSSSNFAKLGWAKASRIGCNREICLFQQQNVTVSKIVCVLGEEKGAVIGQPIYSSGATCSACPSGYSCSNSLCVKTVSECSVSD
ncbi:unnamed protein product [Bursaphelenchus xylophilus]|nr:unnamed protein product [Bursaphelenchus xylophilus]CAG9125360.1 unnamed protein product [Bursaphelenchus xylophilus]